MPHYRVFPSKYAPFQIQADTDHWNELTHGSLDLIARLVNGDHAVLTDSEAAGGVINNTDDGQQLRVDDIDTTAKTLKVIELRTRRGGRAIPRVAAAQSRMRRF